MMFSARQKQYVLERAVLMFTRWHQDSKLSPKPLKKGDQTRLDELKFILTGAMSDTDGLVEDVCPHCLAKHNHRIGE